MIITNKTSPTTNPEKIFSCLLDSRFVIALRLCKSIKLKTATVTSSPNPRRAYSEYVNPSITMFACPEKKYWN